MSPRKFMSPLLTFIPLISIILFIPERPLLKE